MPSGMVDHSMRRRGLARRRSAVMVASRLVLEQRVHVEVVSAATDFVRIVAAIQVDRSTDKRVIDVELVVAIVQFDIETVIDRHALQRHPIIVFAPVDFDVFVISLVDPDDVVAAVHVGIQLVGRRRILNCDIVVSGVAVDVDPITGGRMIEVEFVVAAAEFDIDVIGSIRICDDHFVVMTVGTDDDVSGDGVVNTDQVVAAVGVDDQVAVTRVVELEIVDKDAIVATVHRDKHVVDRRCIDFERRALSIDRGRAVQIVSGDPDRSIDAGYVDTVARSVAYDVKVVSDHLNSDVAGHQQSLVDLLNP